METRIKWNEGEGYITATYNGSGNGSASISSDINEGINRKQSIKIETTNKSISATLTILQEGMREIFDPSDGELVLADGGTFNVLKAEKAQNTYLTITALEDDLEVSFSMVDVEYSLDDGKSWSWLSVKDNTPKINKGEKVMFRATLTPVEDKGIGICYVSKNAALSGTPMSLLYGDEHTKYDNVPAYSFYNLFYGQSTIVSVSDDFLPATIIGNRCYYQMFYRCTSLQNAPSLPSLETKDRSYFSMFNGCTSLTDAPLLPATKLGVYCYYNMFYNCSSLINASELPATELTEYCYYNMYRLTAIEVAPVLPAETLVAHCYNSMFRDCVNLKYIKAMFKTMPSDDYTKNWVYGVASDGTFVKNKDASWSVSGKNGIPSGWIILTE